MKKTARAVIGGAFGDEGKGLVVDYLCRQSDDVPMVVRFSGGAQAGHTVVAPDGRRHVFHHFGAGGLLNAPTFLGRDFLVNPVLWRLERNDLHQKLLTPDALTLRIDSRARITTVYDMIYNQALEMSRGDERHGSCGVGVHETVSRSKAPGMRLLACDLDSEATVRHYVSKIRAYQRKRMQYNGLWTQTAEDFFGSDEVYEAYVSDCVELAESSLVTDTRTLANYEVVFEGSQGLLLDQNFSSGFPHVTCASTGVSGALEIAADLGIDQVDVHYVLRTYLTRHGAGPLWGEDPEMKFEDTTNVSHDWQGKLRFAPMTKDVVLAEIISDVGKSASFDVDVVPTLAITHMDQKSHDFSDWPFDVSLESWGAKPENVNKLTRA